MADVLVNDRSLMDIGDALRRKHGETKPGIVIEYEPVVKINKSPLATG